MVEGITVVKFGMNDGGGNGRGCFEIEVRADASELTNMVINDNVFVPPADDCWTCYDIGPVHLVGGPSLWLVRWHGTRCQTTCGRSPSAGTHSDNI